MADVKRYTPIISCDPPHEIEMFEIKPDLVYHNGEWIKAADHDAKVADLERLLAQVTKQLDAVLQQLSDSQEAKGVLGTALDQVTAERNSALEIANRVLTGRKYTDIADAVAQLAQIVVSEVDNAKVADKNVDTLTADNAALVEPEEG